MRDTSLHFSLLLTMFISLTLKLGHANKNDKNAEIPSNGQEAGGNARSSRNGKKYCIESINMDFETNFETDFEL